MIMMMMNKIAIFKTHSQVMKIIMKMNKNHLKCPVIALMNKKNNILRAIWLHAIKNNNNNKFYISNFDFFKDKSLFSF